MTIKSMAIFIHILLIVGLYSIVVEWWRVREIQCQVWKKVSFSFLQHSVVIWLVQGVTNCWPHCCWPVPEHGQWITDLWAACVWLLGRTIWPWHKSSQTSISHLLGKKTIWLVVDIQEACSVQPDHSPRQVHSVSRSYLSDCFKRMLQGKVTCHILYVQTYNISDFSKFRGWGQVNKILQISR